jgi:hypothetical protein
MALTPENALIGLKGSVARLADARKKVDPRFEDIAKEIGAAIEKGDKPMIEFYLKSLKPTIAAITEAMSDVSTAEGQIRGIEKEEDFLASNYDEVEKLGKAVSDAKKHFTKRYQDAKRLENTAEKALGTAGSADDEALQKLARLDHEVKDTVKRWKGWAEDAARIDDEATAAVEARDAKALAAAQKAIRPLTVLITPEMHKITKDEIDAIARRADDKKISEAVRADLKDGAKDLLAAFAPAAGYLEKVQSVGKRVGALDVGAIDVKKALKVLGIEAKHEAKLAKVLKGPPANFEKGLSALAKELKLDTTGKDMLAELRKAHVL